MIRINELKEQQSLEAPFLVAMVKEGITTSKAPYVSVTLQDKTGTIEGKLWDVKEAQKEVLKLGCVVMVRAEVLKYRGNLQLRIHDVKAVDPTEVDVNEFLPSGGIEKADLMKEVYEAIASIENPNLKLLVEVLLKENEEKFFDHPAAARNHHEFTGGLATHVVEMLRLANVICDLYPMLDRDLLISGVLVHDMGKIIELSSAVVPEYTVEGRLLGHISIMQAKVAEVAKKLNMEDETIVLLRHMILSHHGEYEFGSPVLPMIPEAVVLHMIDNLDARMEMMRKALESVEEGQFTQRIFSLENRSLYKAKKEDNR
ncbi:MAG: OB-fold nucleic acid binding domain-containing protein [Erysipelotrichaceae bacterium]|nr:OB-fold nucleic acid binding domain-containing protein [Erysipelotrichaceae bacterium]